MLTQAVFLLLGLLLPALPAPAGNPLPLAVRDHAAPSGLSHPGLELGVPADVTLPIIRPVVIDAGHGGKDLGAVVRGVYEKDIALAVARKLKDALAEAGAPPGALIRDDDVYVPLDERVSESISLKGDVFISIHANKVRYKNRRGIAVYVYGGKKDRRKRRWRLPYLPPPPRETREASRTLARSVVRSLRREGLEVEVPLREKYYVLRNPTVPSILVEIGYLSNPEEGRLLKDPEYQERLARALAGGLTRYVAQSKKAERSVVTGR